MAEAVQEAQVEKPPEPEKNTYLVTNPGTIVGGELLEVGAEVQLSAEEAKAHRERGVGLTDKPQEEKKS